MGSGLGRGRGGTGRQGGGRHSTFHTYLLSLPLLTCRCAAWLRFVERLCAASWTTPRMTSWVPSAPPWPARRQGRTSLMRQKVGGWLVGGGGERGWGGRRVGWAWDRCASKAAAEGMRGDTVWVQSGCEQRHWTSSFLLSATTPQSTFYCCAPPPLHTQPWAPLSLAPKLSSAIRRSTACSPSSRDSTLYCCPPPPLHTQPWAPLSLAPKLSSAIRRSTACSLSSRGSRRSRRPSTLLSLSTPTTTVSQIMRGRGQSVWKLL